MLQQKKKVGNFMKKLIKRIKCPECGAEFEGFWVNPICTCGHQLRELTTTEAAWSNIDKYDAVQDKRDSVRNSEWGFVDFKWISIIILSFIPIDIAFIIKFLIPCNSTTDLVMLISAIVMGVSMVLFWIYALIKTIYFRRLENIDDKYFFLNERKNEA